MSTLYLNGVIHSVADPYATAMIVDHGMITWVGADDSAERMLRATGVTHHETVDLQGALVTPAFVDSWSTRDASDHPAEQGCSSQPGRPAQAIRWPTSRSPPRTSFPTTDTPAGCLSTVQMRQGTRGECCGLRPNAPSRPWSFLRTRTPWLPCWTTSQA